VGEGEDDIYGQYRESIQLHFDKLEMGLHGYEFIVEVIPTSLGKGEEEQDFGKSIITGSFQIDQLAIENKILQII